MTADASALALLYTMMPLWLVALIAGAAVPWALIREKRLAPLDLPGPHRSHATPTPRGGGLGIVVALIGALVGIWLASTRPGVGADAAWLALAIALVGTVGALDDRYGLPAWPRLAVHFVAAAIALHAIGLFAPPYAFTAVLVVAIAWSINLHNFMDGANGLLALQALFVTGTIAALALVDGVAPLATLAGAAALACVGFLPFNFPRARIFLGDVGSGVIGLAVAVLALRAIVTDTLPLPGALVLVSTFVVDATLTLATRALRGRRWYARHREHLYQWLVRGGWSHARVATAYTAWNLWVVLPCVLATRIVDRPTAWAIAGVVHAVAIAAWFVGKRAIGRARRRPRVDVAPGRTHDAAGA